MNEKVENQGKRYLLILPCSKRKKPVSKAPALELYDGPFYRVLRKNISANLDSSILSAKYGLISSQDTISYYDQIMTPELAEKLSSEITTKLEEILVDGCYGEIFINLGKTYMLALEGSKNMLDEYNVYWASGQIGERLHQLKTWLTTIRVEEKAIS
jgi:hypothetical protein